MIQMLNRCLLKLSVPKLEYRKFISGCSYDGDEDENEVMQDPLLILSNWHPQGSGWRAEKSPCEG